MTRMINDCCWTGDSGGDAGSDSSSVSSSVTMSRGGVVGLDIPYLSDQLFALNQTVIVG
jgi:hypothetical protein